jgi:predicted SAM-dependent methyltransferase
MKEFERRGWLTWGIDNNKNICGHDNIYKGDFETYDFTRKLADSSLLEHLKDGVSEIKLVYDMLWLGNTLSCLRDPIEALKRCSGLLSEDGVIFISVPDIDFVTKCGISAYPHFNKHEYYTLWNKQSIVRELERIGFEVIVAKRNFKASYSNYYDVHIIAQKRYF